MTADTMPNGWVSPHCAIIALGEGEFGMVAAAPIARDELLVVWGGDIYERADFDGLPASKKRHSVQVEEDLYLVPVHPPGPVEYTNHSCNPTAGLLGQIALVALRDIAPGEAITYDYATSDGTPYDEFDCHCGAPNCRGRVTGDDWRSPVLWERYAGHFSPYLQRRIDALKAAQAARVRPARRVPRARAGYFLGRYGARGK